MPGGRRREVRPAGRGAGLRGPRALSVLFANGRIHLGTGRWAEALVAKHGRVAAAGTLSEARAAHPEARLIDLRGGLMLPGLVDSHVHFLWWAVRRSRVDLESAPTLEAALETVAAYARSLPAEAWIQGGRFDKNRWGRWPMAAELDRASGGRPAMLRSRDGHARWLNSRALARAGITAATPTPAGGDILRASDGAPSGILLENAIRLLDGVVPEPSDEELLSALREGQREALALGVTGIHDLDDPQAPALRAFQTLHGRGELVLRAHIGIPHRALDAALALGIGTGLGDAWLRLSNLKIFSDGALGSQTAALEEPYAGSAERGILTVEPEHLAADVRRAAAGGIAVAIHAIGDRAVRVALDAIEAAGGSRALRAQGPLPLGLRHRVEHIQLVRDEDVARFARLGVIASMQPIHATSDRDLADRYWGERCRRAYPWRALREAGVTLAFGSDAAVEPIAPLLGLYAAVARKRPSDAEAWYPKQRLSLEEAIEGYTLGAARAVSRETELGTLDVGKWCDAVVLDRDVFTEPPEVLLEGDAGQAGSARVRATITAGEVRYEKGLG